MTHVWVVVASRDVGFLSKEPTPCSVFTDPKVAKAFCKLKNERAKTAKYFVRKLKLDAWSPEIMI